MADADSWLIDTSIVVDILRGHSPAKDWVDTLPEEGRFVSVVTAAELVAGCRNQAEQRRVEREIALYTTVWLDETVSQAALELYKKFHLSHGAAFLDCLIAATAINNGLRLATLNLTHFVPFPDIHAERPY